MSYDFISFMLWQIWRMWKDNFRYTKAEWDIAKGLTIILWAAWCIRILITYNTQPFPEGICNLLDCSVLVRIPFLYFTAFSIIVLGVLYVLERQMLIVTFLISVLSIILFSLEIANGGRSSRMEILSAVLIAQFIAYLQYSFSKPQVKLTSPVFDIAMMYSVQIIGAGYVVSALSKLDESGLSWINEAQNFSVRVIRAYTSRSIDLADPALADKGRAVADFILQNILLLKALFFLILLIELFAFVGAYSKRLAKWYGVLLFAMHMGILFVFGGVLIPFFVLTVIYLINIPSFFSKSKQLSIHIPNRVSSFAFWRNLPCMVIHFKVPVVFIGLSFIVGETHPFSKFPMFASSSNTTELYYLTDKTSNPISGLQVFSIRCGEIKNMLYAEAANKSVRTEDTEGMKNIAHTVLHEIIETRKPKTKNHIDTVLLLKQTILLKEGEIVTTAEIMAKANLR